jgi:hypothetical protein
MVRIIFKFHNKRVRQTQRYIIETLVEVEGVFFCVCSEYDEKPTNEGIVVV